MLIRKNYIKHELINFLKSYSGQLYFPVDVLSLFNNIDKCKVYTYKHFAEKYKISIEQVIKECQSSDACTYYNNTINAYIVLYNDDLTTTNRSRILWTLAHEMGHIVLKHPLAYNYNNDYKRFELEADYFAANLLTPFAVFENYKVDSICKIQKYFGVSHQAAKYRWDQYKYWKLYEYKSFFDGDIKRIFAIH